MGQKENAVTLFLGVFNSCLRLKRIRSDLKSIINQFITYIADQKNVSS